MSLDNASHCPNDDIHVRIGHIGINRQRHDALIGIGSFGKIRRLVAESPPIIGMKMQRNKMHRAADVLFPQRLDELTPVDRQALELELDDVKVPGVFFFGVGERGANFRQIGERRGLSIGNAPARRRKAPAFF